MYIIMDYYKKYLKNKNLYIKKKNSLLKLRGGFTPCDTTDPNFMMSVILNKLGELEGTGWDEIYITKFMDNFFDIYNNLIKYYKDESTYSQKFKGVDDKILGENPNTREQYYEKKLSIWHPMKII